MVDRFANRSAVVRAGRVAGVALACVPFLAFAPTALAASMVRISKLVDVSLLSLDPLVQASRSQSICVFSNSPTKGYNVTARGSGAGAAFTLSGGAGIPVLPYSVQWSGQSGQTAGATLTPNVALTALTTTATQQACTSGPATTASLIVVLSPSDLQSASSGINYTGVLTLVIAPE